MTEDSKLPSVRDIVETMLAKEKLTPRLVNEPRPQRPTDYQFIAMELATYKNDYPDGDMETEWADDPLKLDPDWDESLIKLFDEAGFDSKRMDHWRLLLSLFADFYTTDEIQHADSADHVSAYKWSPERNDLLLQKAAELWNAQTISRVDLWHLLRKLPEFRRKGERWAGQPMTMHAIRGQYTEAKQGRSLDVLNGKLDSDPVYKKQLVGWLIALERDEEARYRLLATLN